MAERSARRAPIGTTRITVRFLTTWPGLLGAANGSFARLAYLRAQNPPQIYAHERYRRSTGVSRWKTLIKFMRNYLKDCWRCLWRKQKEDCAVRCTLPEGDSGRNSVCRGGSEVDPVGAPDISRNFFDPI